MADIGFSFFSKTLSRVELIDRVYLLVEKSSSESYQERIRSLLVAADPTRAVLIHLAVADGRGKIVFLSAILAGGFFQ